MFAFDSEYGEEDVTYTLEQVFWGFLCLVAIKVVSEEEEKHFLGPK